MRLKGKTAIITGGSRGIGRAVAKAFLTEGANVAIAARSGAELRSTLLELKELGAIIGTKTDVSDKDDVERLVSGTLAEYGSVDVLVNAAAVQSPMGLFIETEADEWLKNIMINLLGTALCCRYVLPIMVEAKKRNKTRGKIINFSGGGATSARPFFSAYAASKAAVVRFTETVSEEVREFGIDVNAVAPGEVNTGMLEEVINAGQRVGSEESRKALERKLAGGVPPELAAELVVFLSSGDSDGITGKLISARWDPYTDDDFTDALRNDRDIASLRRIDGRTFFKATVNHRHA